MNPTVQALIAAGYPVQRVNSDKNPAAGRQVRRADESRVSS